MEEETINKCAELLSDLGCERSGEQLSLMINCLAISTSKDKNSDELNVIGNFIVALGGLLLAIAAQRQSCENKQDKLKQIKDLKKQIKDLEDSL